MSTVQDDMKDKQAGTVPGECDTCASVYSTLREEIHLRIGLQNKCVEMSVNITSALAVAIVGAILAKQVGVSLFSNKIAIIAVFGFYGLIQSLILTNYIYQTYFCLRLCGYIRDRKQKSQKATNHLAPGGMEGISLPQDKNALKYLPGKIILRLQPIIIYCSAVAAWIIVSFVLLKQPRLLAAYLPFSTTIALVILLWISVVFLWVLHQEAQRLALWRENGIEKETIIL